MLAIHHQGNFYYLHTTCHQSLHREVYVQFTLLYYVIIFTKEPKLNLLKEETL